jgi:hypothetical protein
MLDGMDPTTHLLIWRGLDDWHVEASSVQLAPDGLVATGTQIGSDPVAYRLDYRLDARGDFVTRSLEVIVTGDGWTRRLDLRHDGGGGWTCQAFAEGEVDLPAPGCQDPSTLAGAIDCDLGRSPLTNAMPILRSGLARPGGPASPANGLPIPAPGAGEAADAEDFVMAWVAVPSLEVFASAQRYERVRGGEDGAVVRYVDRGRFEGFTAELRLDRHGFVTHYPGLAERVGDEPGGARPAADAS